MPLHGNPRVHQGQVVSGISNNGPGYVQLSGLKIDSAVDMVTAATPRGLPSGRIVSMNAVGNLETGLDPAVPMPIPFMLMESDQFASDVSTNRNYNPQTDAGFGYLPVDSGGNVAIVPLCTGYLCATTEYDKTVSTYAPNTPLTARRANTNAVTGGVLTTGVKGTDHICGIAVGGPDGKTNPVNMELYRYSGMKMLWFIAYFFPKS